MKTYAENKGLAPFDWNKEIDKAIESEPTEDEFDQRDDKASEWVTCACGNLCAVIPRYSTGEPVDAILRRLGFDFMMLVNYRKWSEAKRTLQEIEERSAGILKLINESKWTIIRNEPDEE